MVDDNKKKNNVLQFGPIQKKEHVPEKPVPKIIKGLDEYDALDEELVVLIQTHTDNIMNGVVKYLAQQKILDPTSIPQINFGDIILIKESVTSMLCRKAKVQHDLQNFVDFNLQYDPPAFNEPT